MRKKQIITHYQELDRDELSGEERADLKIADNARKEAYAPYSQYHVGATIRTNAGAIFTGHNVENVGYEALHAEHGALGAMNKRDRKSGIRRITIVAGPHPEGSDEPSGVSCGSCSQKIIEHLRSEDLETAYMISAGTRGKVLRILLKDLLLLSFFPACLNDKK